MKIRLFINGFCVTQREVCMENLLVVNSVKCDCSGYSHEKCMINLIIIILVLLQCSLRKRSKVNIFNCLERM